MWATTQPKPTMVYHHCHVKPFNRALQVLSVPCKVFRDGMGGLVGVRAAQSHNPSNQQIKNIVEICTSFQFYLVSEGKLNCGFKLKEYFGFSFIYFLSLFIFSWYLFMMLPTKLPFVWLLHPRSVIKWSPKVLSNSHHDRAWGSRIPPKHVCVVYLSFVMP